MFPLHLSLGFDLTEDNILSGIGEDADRLMPQRNFEDGSLVEEDMTKTLPDAMWGPFSNIVIITESNDQEAPQDFLLQTLV